MPLSALDNVAVDHKLTVAEIGPLLARLAREDAPAEPLLGAEERERMGIEVKIAEGHDAREHDVLGFGELSPFTCPECRGVMTMIREGRLMRFRCHTGHALSADTLLEGATEQIEQRLYDALRGLDESILLLNKLGEAYAARGDTAIAEQCFSRAQAAFERSRPVRDAAVANDEMTLDELRPAQRNR
jgi:two-component system chemotaxis response regulator CheB